MKGIGPGGMPGGGNDFDSNDGGYEASWSLVPIEPEPGVVFELV